MHYRRSSNPVTGKRKRQDEPTTATKPSAGTKKARRTPPSFWDTLSRQWLTRRALREFDRRTQLEQESSKPGGGFPSAAPAPALKRFARQGGPNLDNIRAYPKPHSNPEMPASNQDRLNPEMPASKQDRLKRKTSAKSGNSSKRSTSETGRSSAYDRAFEGKMIDNGFFTTGHHVTADGEPLLPVDWDELNARLTEPRGSLSPTQFTHKDFREFERCNDDAATEADVMNGPFSIIAGKSSIPKKQDVWFNNLAELATDIQKGIRVDYYNGSIPSDMKRSLRDELSEYIVPSTITRLPILPNFFVEAKGPDGNASVVKRQALHNGVIGARGIHKLREHTNPEKLLDGKAYTITSTYSGGSGGGILTLYTVHPAASQYPAREQDYYMTKLGAFAMDGDSDTFGKGATAFRNSREWAKEQREQLIRDVNSALDESVSVSSTATGQTADSGLSQSVAVARVDSDMSADELSVDMVETNAKSKGS